MKKRLWLLAPLAIVIIGVVLVNLGFRSFYYARDLQARGVTAVGVVIENVEVNEGKDVSSYPRVRFRTKTGQEVVFLSGDSAGSFSPYKVNDTVTVLYDPQNPSDAFIPRLAANTEFSYFFGGTLFVLLGVGIIVAVRRHERKIAWLRQNGHRVQTDFVRVQVSTSSDDSGITSTSYQVISSWLNPETNQTHTFKSDLFRSYPTDLVTGKTIDVVLDPANPKRYFVDLSWAAPTARRAS